MTNNNYNYKKISHRHLSSLWSRQSRGLTFIEVLVSLSVFSLLMIVASDIYVQAIDLQRQAEARKAVQENMTFFLEFLGKEFRNGEIDYNDDTLGSQPQEQLDLLIRERTSTESIVFDKNNKKIIVFRDGEQSDLTNELVTVEDLKFYLAPSQKCSDSVSDCQSQQRVTVVASMKSNTIQDVRGVKGFTLDIQTTFAARLYDI